jgi:transporter family-2 protein
MEFLALAILALLAGAGLPVQASVNSAMRQQIGRPEWAALVNFAVGTVALGAFLLLRRLPVPPAAAWSQAPWWAWTGGLLGAFFVAATVVLTPRLGLVTTLALMLVGQVTAAAVLDHHGLLGLATRPFTPTRALGAVLLVAGVLLVQR